MLLNADRAHAGAAAAMRDAKRLVKIEMADISAIFPWLRQADLRIEIGAVEIDLPAVSVNDAANFANCGFEHAMRRGISDHHRREAVGILLRLIPQVGEIDVAVTVASDDNNIHPSHVRG